MRRDPADVTGRGPSVDDARLSHKIEVIRRALAPNQPERGNALDVLSKVGGAEIGVMMGVVIGAAAERIPLVADGFISTAAAALAVAYCQTARDYLFLAHRSVEPGQTALLDFIGQKPLLDLQMRLGEGTGAALAMRLIEAAAKLLSEMATFSEAGVSDKG